MASPVILTFKSQLLARNTSCEPLSVCASAAVWLVNTIEKKITIKKVTKVLYFTYLVRTSRPRICTWNHVPDIITCAKFQNRISRGCDFTGVEISIFVLIFEWPLQQYCTTALPVVLHKFLYRYFITDSSLQQESDSSCSGVIVQYATETRYKPDSLLAPRTGGNCMFL